VIPGRQNPKGFLFKWTRKIAAFGQRWPGGSCERVTFHVLLYMGTRDAAAAVAGRQHVHNDVISQIQTEQTGTWVQIPILSELKATLEAGPTADLPLSSPRRKPETRRPARQPSRQSP